MSGMPELPPESAFAARLDHIRQRIARMSADPSSVRIVAVTKGFPVGAVELSLAAGLTDLGENYADELVAKAGEVGAGPGVDWHYLGAVQRNKVARLAPVVTWWQALSRVEEGVAIARRAPGATVLVQVDVAGLAGRGGCAPDRVGDLVGALRQEDLDVVGLMAVGPPGPPERRGPASPWCPGWPTACPCPSAPWGCPMTWRWRWPRARPWCVWGGRCSAPGPRKAGRPRPDRNPGGPPRNRTTGLRRAADVAPTHPRNHALRCAQEDTCQLHS